MTSLRAPKICLYLHISERVELTSMTEEDAAFLAEHNPELLIFFKDETDQERIDRLEAAGIPVYRSMEERLKNIMEG